MLIVSMAVANCGALWRLADKLGLPFQHFLEFCVSRQLSARLASFGAFGFVAGVLRSLLTLSNTSRILVVLTHWYCPQKLRRHPLGW